jgi:serine protease Do
MLSRLISLLMLAVTLSFSALGTAFGADKEKQAFLGVVTGEVTSEIADEYGVRPGQGVLVTGVSPDSPAQKIGLRENDIIISVNTNGITGPEEFRNTISKMKPGANVDLVYVRGGKQRNVSVELSSREDREFGFFGRQLPEPGKPTPAPRARVFRWRSDSDKERGEEEEHAEKVAFAGIVTQDLSEGLAEYFKVKEGALISEVVKDSPADKAGLKAGDVIVKIGDEDIEDEGDVRSAIQDHKPGDQVAFVVMRDGSETTINVTLGEQDSSDLGELKIDLGNLESLKALEALKNAPELNPSDDQLKDLEQKLEQLNIQIEGLDPMDIHIDQAPDAPGVHIQQHASPIRNDHQRDWRESLQRLRDIVSAEFHQLENDFARLRDELVDLGAELMGRTA